MEKQLKADLSVGNVEKQIKAIFTQNDTVRLEELKRLTGIYSDVLAAVVRSLLSILKSSSIPEDQIETYGVKTIEILKSVALVTKSEKKYLVGDAKSNKSISVRHKLTEIWLALFELKLNDSLIVMILNELGVNSLIDRLSEARLLQNYIFAIFDPPTDDFEPSWSMHASRVVLKLVTKHGANYDRLYPRLLDLLKPEILFDNVKLLGQFLDDMDIYLSSLILPINTVAEFCKRLGEVALVAPMPIQPALLHLIERTLKRHEKARVLVNARSTPEETSSALSTSLWEVEALSRSPSQEVRNMATRILRPMDIRLIPQNDAESEELIEKPLSKVLESSLDKQLKLEADVISKVMNLYKSNKSVPQLEPLPGWK